MPNLGAIFEIVHGLPPNGIGPEVGWQFAAEIFHIIIKFKNQLKYLPFYANYGCYILKLGFEHDEDVKGNRLWMNLLNELEKIQEEAEAALYVKHVDDIEVLC